jgi:hypothetical protein
VAETCDGREKVIQATIAAIAVKPSRERIRNCSLGGVVSASPSAGLRKALIAARENSDPGETAHSHVAQSYRIVSPL